MLCVEFLQVKYIDVSDITHFLKASAITNCEHLNLSMIFVVSPFLSNKLSPTPPPWMEVKPGFREIVSLSP